MRRRTFDLLASCIGALLTVVLLVAGGLLMWGYTYTTSNVHDQLAAQKIYFPPKAAFANPQVGTEITPAMIPSVSQYAGQQLLTAAQSQVYANDFIGQHLINIGGGKTYSEVSAAAMALPANSPQRAALEAQAQTLFQGNTLRGLLLEAYGFGTMGEIALIASIASFILAGLMFVLTMFGFLHFRKVDEETELLAKTKSEPMGDKEPALV